MIGAEAATELEALRRRAFAIAYRMLGSVAEAEDIVQEALLRLHRVREGGETIEAPMAYVSTIATRLAIDHLRSARVRREQYVGDWLPEPLVESAEGDPAQRAEMVESLSFAFLAVLERLSPEQRAVLLAARRVRVRLRRDRGDPGPHAAERPPARGARAAPRAAGAAALCRVAAATGAPCVQLLCRGRARRPQGAGSGAGQDVVLRGDGGGKAPALGHSIHGRAEVARTLLAWVQMADRFGASIQPVSVNGGPGALVMDPGGLLIAVWALDVVDGAVRGVASIVNPDKLRHIAAVGSMRDALRQARPR